MQRIMFVFFCKETVKWEEFKNLSFPDASLSMVMKVIRVRAFGSGEGKVLVLVDEPAKTGDAHGIVQLTSPLRTHSEDALPWLRFAFSSLRPVYQGAVLKNLSDSGTPITWISLAPATLDDSFCAPVPLRMHLGCLLEKRMMKETARRCVGHVVALSGGHWRTMQKVSKAMTEYLSPLPLLEENVVVAFLMSLEIDDENGSNLCANESSAFTTFLAHGILSVPVQPEGIVAGESVIEWLHSGHIVLNGLTLAEDKSFKSFIPALSFFTALRWCGMQTPASAASSSGESDLSSDYSDDCSMEEVEEEEGAANDNMRMSSGGRDELSSLGQTGVDSRKYYIAPSEHRTVLMREQLRALIALDPATPEAHANEWQSLERLTARWWVLAFLSLQIVEAPDQPRAIAIASRKKGESQNEESNFLLLCGHRVVRGLSPLIVPPPQARYLELSDSFNKCKDVELAAGDVILAMAGQKYADLLIIVKVLRKESDDAAGSSAPQTETGLVFVQAKYSNVVSTSQMRPSQVLSTVASLVRERGTLFNVKEGYKGNNSIARLRVREENVFFVFSTLRKTSANFSQQVGKAMSGARRSGRAVKVEKSLNDLKEAQSFRGTLVVSDSHVEGARSFGILRNLMVARAALDSGGDPMV